MLKGILVKMGIPLACALSVAFAPMGVSAGPYYGNYSGSDCCDPCQPDPCCRKSSWLRDAAIFAGAAAVGAVAGVVAANSNKSRGKRGFPGTDGTNGTNGTNGINGTNGLGFVVATIPAGQTNAGAPITSLTFCFDTLVALTLGLPPGTSFQAYVTTPDGRTFLGTTFTGLIGSSATVTIPSGPFFVGQYDVGIIAPNGALISAGALVSADVCQINGAAVVGNLADVGIVLAVALLTERTFYNASYPFPQVP